MKNSNEVLAKARRCVNAELELRLELATRRLPHRCQHNYRQSLDVRRTVNGESNPHYNRINNDGSQTIGLCMLGAADVENWPGNICEDPIDAQRCPYFTATETKESLLESFSKDLSDLGWIEKNMPGLAELLWVLDDGQIPGVGWLRRLLLRFHVIRLEPVKPPVNLLLPNGSP